MPFQRALKQVLNKLRQTPMNSVIRAVDAALHGRGESIRVLVAFSGSWHLSAVSSMLTLVEELEKYPQVQLGLLNFSNEPPKFDTIQQEAVYARNLLPRGGKAFFSKWHYVITSVPTMPDLFWDSINITMDHGPTFGKHCELRLADPTVRRAKSDYVDVIFGLSAAQYAYLKRVAPEVFSEYKRLFFPVGFPKTDSLVNGNFSRMQFLESRGLDPRRKTILVSSHWCVNSILRTFGASIIEQLRPLSDECNILITGHTLLWKSDWWDNEACALLLKEIENAISKMPFAHFVRTVNELPLLNSADLLIADHSSIFSQFCLLDRPILFFDHPSVKFDDEVKAVYLSASEAFTELDKLEQKCSDLLLHPQRDAAGRKAAVEYFYANPGTAGKTVAETLISLGPITSKNSYLWQNAIALSNRSLSSH